MYKLIDCEKFHSMQATVETVRFDDGMTVKRLVSYDSIVCDICLDTGTVFLYPRYQYSPTTVRQVTRFLNEYVPLTNDYWCIALIRELEKKVDSDCYTAIAEYNIFFLDHVIGATRFNPQRSKKIYIS